MHIAFLADAVNTTETLLQARWIPGQVVINHQPTELKIDAFAGCLGRHADLAGSTKILLCALPFVGIHTTVDLAGRVSPSVQVVEEMS